MKKINKVVKKVKLAGETKAEPKKFKLTLDLSGLVFIAEADTFKEALEMLYKDSLGKVKTWSVITLETGGKKSSIQYRPIQMKRAFLGRFAQDLLEKRLSILLK